MAKITVKDTEIVFYKKEQDDYTQWKENLFVGMSVEEISKKAMEYQKGKRNVV